MNVSTVTTLDRSHLGAVRGAIEGADDALLCVAFVQERGLHLLEKELKDLRGRRDVLRGTLRPLGPARVCPPIAYDGSTRPVIPSE